jgi:hypothetical protein
MPRLLKKARERKVLNNTIDTDTNWFFSCSSKDNEYPPGVATESYALAIDAVGGDWSLTLSLFSPNRALEFCTERQAYATSAAILPSHNSPVSMEFDVPLSLGDLLRRFARFRCFFENPDNHQDRLEVPLEGIPFNEYHKWHRKLEDIPWLDEEDHELAMTAKPLQWLFSWDGCDLANAEFTRVEVVEAWNNFDCVAFTRNYAGCLRISSSTS